MKNLFNPDNPIFNFINRLLDLIVLSILWAVCCIPIVTAGASCSALYFSIVKAFRAQEGYAAKTFFTSFRSCIKKGIVLTLAWVLFAVMLFFSDAPVLAALLSGDWTQTISCVIVLLKLFLLLAWAVWIIPLLAHFDETILKLAESALLLSFRHFAQTCLAVILIVLLVLLLILEPLLAALLPAPVCLLLSYLIEPSMQSLIDRNSQNEE